MSNTYRKDRNNKIFKETLKKHNGRTRCRCDAERDEIADKIAEKEMKEEIRTIETGENLDFDIPEQDEILEQIMGRI